MLHRSTVLLPLLTALAAGSAYAQEKAAPFKAGTVMVLEHNGLGKLFADPKDKAFGDALAMIPDRIRELPRESKGEMPPEAAPILITALTTLSRPARIAVCYDGDNPSGGAFGYGVVASVLAPAQADADQVQAQVMALMNQNKGGPRPMASKRFPGMMDLQTPIALLSFGPRHAADGWRYEIVFGTVKDPDAVAAALPPAPKGLEPTLRMQFNTAGLNPAADLIKAFAAQNPEAGPAIDRFQSMGLGGEKTVKIDFVAGRTESESVSITTTHGARALADTWGLSTKPLTKEDFAAIPADATDVYLHHGRDGAIFDLDALIAENAEVSKVLEQFQQATGVNLNADIVQALGTSTVVYMSDSTGGAGLGSAVAMISVRDKARLWPAMGKLSAIANMQADHLPLGPGYIRLTATKDGNTDLLTLRFPGLPVPLELTFALTDNWLIFSPTPQGALAASRQASGRGDAGFSTNKLFAASYPKDRQATSITFSDVPRNLSGGYTFLSLAGSAVANGVRSPTDPKRDPGLIVPLFNDLRKDAHASVGYTYWKGDDLISESHSDHSMLVAAAGSGGAVGKILPLLVLPAVFGATQSGSMGHLVMSPVDSLPGNLTSRFLAMSTSPLTAEHIAWTLAAHNAALPVQLRSWIGTPALR